MINGDFFQLKIHLSYLFGLVKPSLIVPQDFRNKIEIKTINIFLNIIVISFTKKFQKNHKKYSSADKDICKIKNKPMITSNMKINKIGYSLIEYPIIKISYCPT